MTVTAFPFDSQDTTESQYSWLMREIAEGVVGTYGGTDLEVYADATGMNVKVRAGKAILRGHMLMSDSTATLTVTAAGASARVDLVVARIDPSTDTGSLVVKAGTAGSPTPPSLTQTDTGVYEIALGTIAVAAGAVTISAGNVSSVRTYVPGRVGVWTTATRPTSPRRRQLGYNETSDRWEVWTGSAWADIAIDAGQVTTGTLPVGRGGTGRTALTGGTSLRNDLGLGTGSAALAIGQGGTGQSTRAAALQALGVAGGMLALPVNYDSEDIDTGLTGDIQVVLTHAAEPPSAIRPCWLRVSTVNNGKFSAGIYTDQPGYFGGTYNVRWIAVRV